MKAGATRALTVPVEDLIDRSVGTPVGGPLTDVLAADDAATLSLMPSQGVNEAMLITYVKYEFVDEVKTLTLAEGPGETGFTMHLMRATWEDDDDVHEVVNGEGDNVLAAISAWHLAGSRLTLAFNTEAAEQLGFEQRMELVL